MSNDLKTSFPVFNGFAPKEGPKALPIAFDFSSVSSMEVDLFTENTNGVIQYVQSVYVDNSLNPNDLEIRFPSTLQKIVIPATAQGVWPVFSIDQVRLTISSTIDPNARGNIILLNVPMPLTQWGPLTVNANITAETITAVLATDFSGVLTLGGTSETVIAANANRKGFLIQNPPTEIESLFVDFGIAAAPGTAIELAPGQIFPPNGSPYVTTQSINVVAATTGHVYIAKEFV
jgi:hypothetical protein